jgi:hypothetical protein
MQKEVMILAHKLCKEATETLPRPDQVKWYWDEDSTKWKADIPPVLFSSCLREAWAEVKARHNMGMKFRAPDKAIWSTVCHIYQGTVYRWHVKQKNGHEYYSGGNIKNKSIWKDVADNNLTRIYDDEISKIP